MVGTVVTSNRSTFAERLKAAMRYRRMTIEGLAQATGLSSSGLKNWSRGKSEPTLSNLVLVADALDVSSGWLSAEEGTMERDSKAGAAVADKQPETAKEAVVTMVGELMREIVEVYRQENARASAADIVDLATKGSIRIMRFTDDFREWPTMVNVVLREIREDLRRPPTADEPSKHRA